MSEDRFKTVDIKCGCGFNHPSKLNLSTRLVKVECTEAPNGGYVVDWANSPDRR